MAIDCEMVGVGPDGEDSILARVSIVNQFGKCIYDKYVKPTEKVTDYRTAVSGIRPEDIKDGERNEMSCKEQLKVCLFLKFRFWCFLNHVCLSAGADVQIVQREVANILEGRIVVGHAIHNDLKVAWMWYLKWNKCSIFQPDYEQPQTISRFRFCSWIIRKRKSEILRNINPLRRS